MSARTLLLGHRGARRAAPENTLEAFDLCLQHGCDGFEFDVRRCADGKGVICHDPKLRGRDVAQSKFDALQAPSLEDVLARYGSRAFLDIELKVPGLEAAVTELVRRYSSPGHYCVSSFLPEVIERLYRLDPAMRLGLICGSRRQLVCWTGVPIQTLFLDSSLCTRGVVDALHAAGKKVMVWTVNREREMRIFAELGVDGIISDDTALLAQTLGSGGLAR